MFVRRGAALGQYRADLVALPEQRDVRAELAPGVHRSADDLPGRVVPAHGVYKDTHRNNSPSV